jgi:hypothetical protein
VFVCPAAKRTHGGSAAGAQPGRAPFPAAALPPLTRTPARQVLKSLCNKSRGVAATPAGGLSGAASAVLAANAFQRAATAAGAGAAAPDATK